MKEKLKSYDFWVAVASAVMVLLQAISMRINIPYINGIAMAVLSLLAVAGILKKNNIVESSEENTQSQDDDQDADENTSQSESQSIVVDVAKANGNAADNQNTDDDSMLTKS